MPSESAAEPPGDPSEAAESLWLEAVARGGGMPDVEELCLRHPELAYELRSIAGDWRWLEGHVGAPGTEDGAELKKLVRGLDPERYTRLEELAEGGGGRIERIWDALLRRSLAMKVAKARAPQERASRSRQLARFLEEAQVTGQLQHPGIVPIHDVGIDEEGFAFFTMDLVEGIDLGEAFRLAREGKEGWNLQRAVRALASVAETLAYAHDRGVLHRDVKPSNVRVGPFGEVYVVDWGLARVQGQPDTQDLVQSVRSGAGSSAFLTAEGAVMGTAAYMPPEQARGDLARLDERADVYAVGAMLYEFLAGEPPYAEEQRTKTPEEVAAAVAKQPPPALAKLVGQAPPELVAIAERAMARRPEQRYDGMVQLAEELRAYLEGRVVRAHRTGVLVEAQKWVLRNRLSAAALVLLIVALAAAAWIQYSRSRELQSINVDLARARTDALGEAHFARLAAAQASLRAGNGRSAASHLAACEPDLRGWAWRHLEARTIHHEGLQEIRVGFSGAGSFARSDDGRYAIGQNLSVSSLAFVEVSVNEAVLYDLVEGTSTSLFPPSGALRPVFLPGTHDLLVATWGGLKRIDCENPESPLAEVVAVENQHRTPLVASSGDGRVVLYLAQDGQLEVRRPEDLELVRRWRPEGLLSQLRGLAVSHDGGLVAGLDDTGQVHVMTPGDGILTTVSAGGIDPTAFTPPILFRPDGLQLAIGRNDGTIELISMPEARIEARIPAFDDHISALAYDPEGKYIACAAFDGTLAVYEVETRTLVFRGYGHQGIVLDLGWSLDGRTIWTASRDGTLRTWRPDRGMGFDAIRTSLGTDLVFLVDPRRERLATSNNYGALELWDTATGDLLARRDFTEAENFSVLNGVFVPPTGELVVSTRYDGLLRLAPGTLEPLAEGESGARDLVVSADGRRVAYLCEQEVRVARVQDLSVEARLPGIEQQTALAFTPSGDGLWAGTAPDGLSLWSLSGSPVRPVVRLSLDAGVVGLATRDELLAVGLRDGRIELRSAKDGALVADLGRSPGPVEVLSFHPGEPLLVSSGRTTAGDASVRLWDIDARQLRCELMGPRGLLRGAVFGASGQWLAAASSDEFLLLDEEPRYRGTELVEAARQRIRPRLEALRRDWPHPEALSLAWRVQPGLDAYERRAGRRLAYAHVAQRSNSLRALRQLLSEPDRLRAHPDASAVLARHVLRHVDDVPSCVIATRVLLLAGRVEEAFEAFQEFEPGLMNVDRETRRAAEELIGAIEAALDG